MKKVLLLLLIIFCLHTNGFSQRKQTSIAECIDDATAFIKFIDTLSTLDYNFKKLYKKNKKRFLIERSIPATKYGSYKYFRFGYKPVGEKVLNNNNPPYQEHAVEIFGWFDIILKKKKPFLIWGWYRLSDILVGPEGYDSSFYKKMNGKILCKKCAKSYWPVKLSYYFGELESNEKKEIAKIVGIELADSIIEDYCQNSVIIEVFEHKKNADDYDLLTDPNLNMLSYQPYLRHIYKIFEQKNYDAFSELLYSKSPVFNWFIAEALNFYNTKDNFLTLKDKGEIANYNGKNGFIKFRSNELLGKLYR